MSTPFKHQTDPNTRYKLNTVNLQTHQPDTNETNNHTTEDNTWMTWVTPG